MKVLVNHPYLGELGGAEQVFSQVVRALVEEREEVLVLGGQPSRETFRQFSDEEATFVPYGRAGFRFRRFQVHQKLLRHELSKLRLRRKIGAVDLEVLTQDVMFLLGVGRKKVAYVHYPENLWRLEDSGARFRKLWKLFYLPVLLSLRKKVAGVDFFLCNSEYTKKAILDRWRRTAEVVYPPVDVENFAPALKEDFVVTLGRYVRTKNYELVVEVAKRMPNLRFVIIGRKESSDSYYEKIKRLKPPNVELLTNVSSSAMSSILSRAKVYLHAMIGEHFGISVVEAMAAGCIPIVHDSGGTKEAIGNFGYVYSDVEDCINCVRNALSSKVESKQIAEYSKRFSSDNFRETFVETLRSKGALRSAA